MALVSQPSTWLTPVLSAGAVRLGAIVSAVQVTVRETDAAGLPHASLTFQVRVCERPHPLLVTALSLAVGVPTLQLSVAVAVPRAALMSDAEGLQPRASVVPVAVITGDCASTVQVTVREAVDELLQASVAVKVLV